MKLYICTTRDKYELPVAVADTQGELAQMVGVSINTVKCALYQAKARGGTSCYKVIEVDDE